MYHLLLIYTYTHLARIYLGNSHSSLGWGFGAQGYVEIYNEESGRYELICDEGWDLNDAHVVCRMLGYPEALDATVRSQHGQSYRDNALFSNVQCTGTEDSIFDCPADPNPSCDRSRSAGVRCSGSQFQYHIAIIKLFSLPILFDNYVIAC